MRASTAWVCVGLSLLIALIWMGPEGFVSSQDRSEDSNESGAQDESSLSLGLPFDVDAQQQFLAQLDDERRELLVKLYSRFALADSACPLPESAPTEAFYAKLRSPLDRALFQRLRDAGAAFVGYAYPNTHFLRAPDAAALAGIGEVLRGSPEVAGTLLREDVDRFSPEAWERMQRPGTRAGEYRLLFWRNASSAAAEDWLRRHNIEVLEGAFDEYGRLELELVPFVDVYLTAENLLEASRNPDLEWIEPKPVLVTYNTTSAALGNAAANQVGPGTSYNLTGEGLVVGVWDGGTVRSTHVGFQGAAANSPINNGTSRVLRVDTSSINNHPTHVTGTIIGDGTGNASARGYAPNAYAVSYDWNNMNTQRMNARHQWRIVADNHSYGTAGGGTGGYDSSTQINDVEIRDIFVNMAKAAGNSGSGSNTVTHDGCLKNSYTIAALNDNGTLASFSSRGPTADGRLIPHFAANGVGLTSPYAGSDTAHNSISGTSMASPSACGSIVLLTELWHREMNNRFFAPDVGRGVLAATIVDSGNVGPDYQFGWGRIDVQRAADLILANKNNNYNHIVRGQIRQNEVVEFPVTVTNSQTPLKVVLSWLDLGASTGSGVKLMNDLDVELVEPNGTTIHHPWSGLTASSQGNQTHQFTRTGPNRRDNLEVVDVENPVTGTWTARIRGFNLATTTLFGELNDILGFVLVSEQPFTHHKSTVEDSINNGAAVPIPDNNATGITRTLNVGGSGDIEQIRLYVDIHHQRRADVRVRLVHPDSTTVTLNDVGASTRPDLIAVYPDTRQYAEDVTALLGKPSAGTWQVIVSDHASGMTGELRYLALEIDVDPSTINAPPIADAGSNQVVDEGDPVQLNGGGSSDPDSDPLSFQWVQTSGPTAQLSGAATATPSFTAPLVAATVDCVFQLSVEDGRGGTDIDTVTVTVVDVNVPPVADAGADFSIVSGQPGNLNGSGSADPDSDPLSFIWAEIGSSLLNLSSSASADPTFIAPMVGTPTQVVMRLTVDDSRGGTDSDEVTVTVNPPNAPPSANAGVDRSVNRGTSVVLNGAGSSDPDGDPLTYQWSQLNGVNTVSLSSQNSAAATFTAPSQDDVLVFQLLVDDGNGGQDTDTVTITVSGASSPGGGGSSDGGDSGGCSTPAGPGAWWLLLVAASVAWLARGASRRKSA